MPGVVLDSDIYGMSCEELANRLKKIKPDIPIVVICAPGDGACHGADFYLESLDPRKLLETLQKLKPAEVSAIEKHEERLNRQHE